MKSTRELPLRRGTGRAAAGLDPALLAAQVLTFLAEDPERLGDFLALTGLDPATLRRASREPGFTAAVLGHLAGDEALLVAFAGQADLAPETVGAVARAVSTPEAPDV